MQTQTTEPTRKTESVDGILRKTYSRNHDSMEDFPVFRQQFHKTQAYLRQNPVDIEKRVYYAHLLTEIGAVPLVVEQAVGLALAAEPIKPFLLYSLKVALKRCRKEEIIAQYSPFESEEVKKYEADTYYAHPCSPLPIEIPMKPIPKKHWWEWQKYEPVKTISRPATFGEIEFLAAQLNEQTW